MSDCREEFLVFGSPLIGEAETREVVECLVDRKTKLGFRQCPIIAILSSTIGGWQERRCGREAEAPPFGRFGTQGALAPDLAIPVHTGFGAG